MSERFWSKVDRRGPNECWPWTAAVSSGTPKVKVRGKVITARRVAWSLTFGDVPDGCDVTSACGAMCMNPAHLRLSRPKLTDADVRAIRRSRLPTKVLAMLYRIDPGNVSRIQRGELWRSVV